MFYDCGCYYDDDEYVWVLVFFTVVYNNNNKKKITKSCSLSPSAFFQNGYVPSVSLMLYCICMCCFCMNTVFLSVAAETVFSCCVHNSSTKVEHRLRTSCPRRFLTDIVCKLKAWSIYLLSPKTFISDWT